MAQGNIAVDGINVVKFTASGVGNIWAISATMPSPEATESIDTATLGNVKIQTSRPKTLSKWTNIMATFDAAYFKTFADLIIGKTPTQMIKEWSGVYADGTVLSNYWGWCGKPTNREVTAEGGGTRAVVEVEIVFGGEDAAGNEVEPSLT